MSKNIWADDAFVDGAPVFEGGQWKEPETYTPAPENTIREARAIQAKAQEEYDVEELTEQVAEESEDEEDFSDMLSDARLRLEQGKLYELIMNHDLFSGVDADPKAAKVVQKQVRKFAKEQMEVMLGMRQTTEAAPMVSSPFNSLEVDILKKLASAASKGATESEEAQAEMPEPVLPPKKKTLNTIGSSKPQAKPQPKPMARKAEPIKRQAKPRPELPPEFEPDYEPLDKPIHKMTAAELAERDRQAAERQRGRKAALPPDRVPMPDFATQEMLAMSQAARATGGVSGMSAMNGKLSQLIIAGAIKKV